MTNKLDSYLTYQFHKEYSQVLFESSSIHLDFMDENNHLLIDVRTFPNISFKLLNPRDCAGYIPEKYFQDYISYTLAYSKVCVYLFENEECFLFCKKNKSDEIAEKIYEAQNETESYLKAYENGLVKEAYEKARKTERPVIFCIINGIADLKTEDEVIDIINKNKNFLGDVDDWKIICIDTNPSLVSFLYIDSSLDKYWYDVLSEDYEADLFEKWNWENYYE